MAPTGATLLEIDDGVADGAAAGGGASGAATVLGDAPLLPGSSLAMSGVSDGSGGALVSAGLSALTAGGFYASPSVLYAKEKRMWRGLEYDAPTASAAAASEGGSAGSVSGADVAALVVRAAAPALDTRIHEGSYGLARHYDGEGRG